MIENKSTVLVVDDNAINRGILEEILTKEYNILEADNGLSAFEIIFNNPNISLILLDLIMPVMDGYQFLEKIRDSNYASILVIVMTAESGVDKEEKVLDLGAIDYIEKPINSKVLLSRVHNAVLRNQMILLEKLKFMSDHDTLTGLYNRSKMFEETTKMLADNEDKQFVFIRYDIDRFRLYNSAMGEKEGNELLKFMAGKIRETAGYFECSTFGRVGADVFCMCEPYDRDKLDKQISIAESYRTSYRKDYVIDSTFGVYFIKDNYESIELMFTKATMAAEKCKHISGVNIAFYEDSMSERLARERWIVKKKKKALEQGQFHVYLQPKYNLKSEQSNGAEALVRWINPDAGMIMPNNFIPIFEKNGFVANLDYYMWENVCILLERWKKEGRKVNPISVNTSRISLYNPNVAENLKDLVGFLHKRG